MARTQASKTENQKDIDPTHRDVLRFWERVQKGSGCWEWKGKRGKYGYGKARAGRVYVLAHRLSWRIHRGVIPLGLMVCHRCDNPPCVRPDHLFLGTAKDNSRDASQKGRLKHDRWQKVADERARQIRALLEAGMTHAMAGAHLGLTADKVRKYLGIQKERRRAITIQPRRVVMGS